MRKLPLVSDMTESSGVSEFLLGSRGVKIAHYNGVGFGALIGDGSPRGPWHPVCTPKSVTGIS
jgi:hypothetical protein